MLFDSHCHLHFPQFDNDREEVISRLNKACIRVINVGTDLEDSEKAVKLAQKHPDLMWATVGLHPNDAPSADFSYESYEKLAESKQVVAIGECGLDYYRATGDKRQETREKQKEVFEKQIELAKALNKPLILHCRPSVGSQDAYEDALDILSSIGFKNGVMHFFSGSKETMKKFLDLSGSARSREARGFYIGFAGPITFAPEYKELVEFVPIDRILIETDAPFAAPASHRGERNEPAFVEFVARKIAEWKGLSFEEVARQTVENAEKLFR